MPHYLKFQDVYHGEFRIYKQKSMDSSLNFTGFYLRNDLLTIKEIVEIHRDIIKKLNNGVNTV